MNIQRIHLGRALLRPPPLPGTIVVPNAIRHSFPDCDSDDGFAAVAQSRNFYAKR
jgi:hypothetical protein